MTTRARTLTSVPDLHGVAEDHPCPRATGVVLRFLREVLVSAGEEISHIRSGLTNQLPDRDPEETQEWLE
ncbi:hypothetical protein ODE13_12205, partial [Nesterenkonia sp. HG001]|nr:hypothetical protein [Nesterenkonia sp. HG001]